MPTVGNQRRSNQIAVLELIAGETLVTMNVTVVGNVHRGAGG